MSETLLTKETDIITNNRERIDTLRNTGKLSKEDLKVLLTTLSDEDAEYLYKNAREKTDEIYGKSVYLRGLIEFSNYCKNDCYYCGIRRSNKNIDRYRLDKDTIIDCANKGYDLGFRTIVLQSGEDLTYSDEDICELVRSIKASHPDVAVTLSLGEKSRESYKCYKDAGADRYLLRHESGVKSHYNKLHPEEMSFDNRIRCLKDLKELGYQVGCGIMVGTPFQTYDDIAEDLLFMQEFNPHMIGIGPFIPHKDTPFKDEKSGSFEDTLHLLSIIRLMIPRVLLPATTALGTIHPLGREMGIKAGANVVMPNLSPTDYRDKYMLYDGKICTGDEAAECRRCMERRIENIGYKVEISRGDYK